MDIDVDVANRDKALIGLPHIAASRVDKEGVRHKHPVGVYFQRVPVDALDQWCAFDYETAATLGYFKVDVLNNTIYQSVRDEAHLVELLTREPVWHLLEDPDVVAGLAHIGRHFRTVDSIRPQSIEDLAVAIAIIRPGKRHLIGRPRHEIDAEIWEPVVTSEGEGYVFKKSHAIAYATSIVVQLNRLVEQVEASEPEP